MNPTDTQAFATGDGPLTPVVLSCPVAGCHYGVIGRVDDAKYRRYSHARRHHLDAEPQRPVSTWATWLGEQDKEVFGGE